MSGRHPSRLGRRVAEFYIDFKIVLVETALLIGFVYELSRFMRAWLRW